MPAYCIIVAVVKDREKFMKMYALRAAALTAEMGGRYLFRGPGAELLEGPTDEPWGADGASVAITEWPSRERALEFWHSSEYQELKKARAGLAEVQVFLVEGDSIADRHD